MKFYSIQTILFNKIKWTADFEAKNKSLLSWNTCRYTIDEKRIYVFIIHIKIAESGKCIYWFKDILKNLHFQIPSRNWIISRNVLAHKIHFENKWKKEFMFFYVFIIHIKRADTRKCIYWFKDILKNLHFQIPSRNWIISRNVLAHKVHFENKWKKEFMFFYVFIIHIKRADTRKCIYWFKDILKNLHFQIPSRNWIISRNVLAHKRSFLKCVLYRKLSAINLNIKLTLRALYIGSTLKFSLEQRHNLISTTFYIVPTSDARWVKAEKHTFLFSVLKNDFEMVHSIVNVLQLLKVGLFSYVEIKYVITTTVRHVHIFICPVFSDRARCTINVRCILIVCMSR